MTVTRVATAVTVAAFVHVTGVLTPIVGIAVFAVIGLGVSAVVPLAWSSAARKEAEVPGRAIATCGYLGSSSVRSRRRPRVRGRASRGGRHAGPAHCRRVPSSAIDARQVLGGDHDDGLATKPRPRSGDHAQNTGTRSGPLKPRTTRAPHARGLAA
jgi:hypothetical protein